MSGRGRSRVAIAVLVLVAVAFLAAVASGLHRQAYGVWFPATPERVDVCGRRYNGHGGSAPTLQAAAGAGMEVRSIGRRPPVVGDEFFAVGRSPEACPPGSVLRRRGDGRFEGYGLSGSL